MVRFNIVIKKKKKNWVVISRIWQNGGPIFTIFTFVCRCCTWIIKVSWYVLVSVPLTPHGCDVTMRCLVTRINHKTLIVICAVFALITILLWNKCSSDKELTTQIRPQLEFAPTPEKEEEEEEDNGQAPEAPPGSREVTYEQIDCLINEDVIIKGRREGHEVYLPFSWVERYFDVYGRLVQYDGTERFEFSHSYSRVYAQREPYHPDGVFMSFEGYNVEVRDRVKCISGVEGSFLKSGVANPAFGELSSCRVQLQLGVSIYRPFFIYCCAPV